MTEVRQAASESDLIAARRLLWEYLQWANASVDREFGIRFDIESMLDDDLTNTYKFFPPSGRILLALQEGKYAGVACLKAIDGSIGEIKRMYVRPDFRRMAVGRALVENSIEAARRIGYRTIRLDSAAFMQAAHALYRSAGFEDIAPYPESEIPQEFQPNWIFMELKLD